MSHRYAAAALNLNTSNRFAMLSEEEEPKPLPVTLPPAAPTRVPSSRTLPPLPKISSSGGGSSGGGGAGASASEGGSYSDRFRARKAGTAAAPNIASQREFPTLGGGGSGGGNGGGGAGAAAAENKWTSGGRPHATPAHTYSSSTTASSWASKAHACAEQDAREAREKEARAVAEAERAYREAVDRSQLVACRVFQSKAPTGPTVTDYEEEDRLRGLLGAHDSYSYDYGYGSHTPPYPPDDEEDAAGPVEEEEERW
jgi:hypothetical protein